MIDDVYRTVQIIANKNNYGVITPDRFNDLARNVQLKIINELPEDLRRAKNRYNTIRSANRGFSDHIRQVQNVIDIFVKRETIRRQTSISDPSGFTPYFPLPDDLHYVESIWFKTNYEVEELDKKKSGYVRKNSLGLVSDQYPTYEKMGGEIFITPSTTGLTITSGVSAINDDVTLVYHRTAKDPKWTYTNVLNQAVFNLADTSYQDFELPSYLTNRIVIDIAGLIGIHLREPEIQQYVQQEQSDDFQHNIIS